VTVDASPSRPPDADNAAAADRWTTVNRLFHEAIALSPEARDVFLAHAGGDDESVASEVRALVAAHDALDGETGPAHTFRSEIDASAALALLDEGRMIGAYRVIGEIGHGGMGTVFLAERNDSFRKRVAVKVLSSSRHTSEALRRFVEERQILASLEHPNIARLLDGGLTAGGIPFYVMEYVDGKAIDRYCDEHRLSIDERLLLFERVCEAVQHAHRHLIVHRDIKPGNILVNEAEGEVKLLDFGIAKVLSGDLAHPTVTRPEARFLTPEYASPEQARGEAVSTASDIYSLGVVLYHLLAGRPPAPARHSADASAPLDRPRPERPSLAVKRSSAEDPIGRHAPVTADDIARARNTTPDRLRRRLAGDLDNIVLLALREEPERRYATVEQMVADLRRHRRGLPVHARPDTWGYRSWKFVRRHRGGVAATIAIAALLVGFSAVTTVQSRRLARERDKAEQVARFLTELFAVSDPGVSRGRAVTARELLDRGALRIDAELGGQPEVRAHMKDVIGRAYFGLGLFDQAHAMLDSALALKRAVHGPAHLEVAAVLFQLAYVRRLQGEFASAEPLYRESLAIRRQHLGEYHPDVIDGMNGLAFFLRGRGDFVQSESVYRAALDRGRRTFRAPTVVLATTLNGLGAALFGQGRHDAAEPFFREALGIFRELEGEDHPDVDIALYNLATALHGAGRFLEAEPLYRDVIARSLRSLGGDHPQFAIGLVGLADVLRDQGRHAEAETLFRDALGIQRRSLPPRSERIATTLVGLGRVMTSLGRPGEGELLLRDALAIRENKLDATHWHVAQARRELGATLSVLGRGVEAESLLVRSLEELRERLGPSDRETRAAADLLERHRAAAASRPR